MRTATYRYIDDLKEEYRKRQAPIARRLADFSRVRPEEYFYELVYCLLTPQSSAVNAGKAIEALKDAHLFEHEVNAAALLHQKDFYVRFHNTKAKRLEEAKRKYAIILAQLTNGSTSRQLREWLVGNVKGLGWKEASHFLRNIGHRDLAILDRHILKNLKKHGVLTAMPKSLTPKRYLTIEVQFARFAGDIGIAMDELDLLFWSRETGEILK